MRPSVVMKYTGTSPRASFPYTVLLAGKKMSQISRTFVPPPLRTPHNYMPQFSKLTLCSLFVICEISDGRSAGHTASMVGKG